MNTAVSMCSWDSMSQHVSTQCWIVRLVPLWRFQLCSLLLLRVIVPKTGGAIDLGFPLVGTMDTSTESVGQCGCSEHPLTLRITTFGESCWVFFRAGM